MQYLIESACQIIADQLGVDVEYVTDEKKIADDLGADSFDSIELVMMMEEGFSIEISNEEAGGEYIVVSQDSIPGRGNVAINPEEWPDIRDAIERMMKECRPINAIDQEPCAAVCARSPAPMG